MLFGKKNDFAIEAMTEPHLKVPSQPWGRLCVWVAGNEIGDYDDPHCGLYPSYESFNEICGILNELWEIEFEHITDIEIWNYLDELLYGYHGNIEINDKRNLNEMCADADKYSKYNFLTNLGEMFDRDGKSFILKTPNGKLKILNFDYNENIINSYLCNEFSFRSAIKDFSAWYEEKLQILDSDNA